MIALSLALLTTPARADYNREVGRQWNPYARRHFYLGAEGVASIVLNQTGPHELITDGGGVNLFFGGRVHRAVAIEFGWQPTFHSQPSDVLVKVQYRGAELIDYDIRGDRSYLSMVNAGLNLTGHF
jgi:hypothetical protein